ncbi:MAG: glycosyl hydrolase [Bacteroidota bacterium]|nr:glycosyl hydrolase [Rhodothermia bacterium]MCS7155605.1 glycosyl hydrolase [Bacteroidota bacterium]MDW8137255.1 glycosyl hydrolase [Bacteroidota bacterium]MDW8284875.1 glycosyl hydrolase [Bacteroidota bacterium]
MRRTRGHLVVAVTCLVLSATQVDAQRDRRTQQGAPPAPAIDLAALNKLPWRLIGPHRGGRVVAVTGDPADRLTFYFGATGGGVWKTTDGGYTWRNISDGFFKTGSVGAIEVAPSDPNVIYVGMGESCIRGNVSHGDGVYKSTDAGKTWRHLGLAETRHIARVRVHPQNPDIVYVAAFGHAFGPNPERGVYRSKDGGKSWERVLYRNERTGAIDLVINPKNPRILYAALWEAQRYPWTFVSGGPGSGIFKSTDGGDTWVEITNNPGLPRGLKGRIGLAVSPANPDRVWALIEAEGEGKGLYRSDDAGATWRRVNNDPPLLQRPWYYMHVYADSQNPDVVYVLNVGFWKSTDGGRSFSQIRVPHGDCHDLWIDPADPKRMINGNDGGACVSYDGGQTWSSIYNQPTAQFYHVTTDNQFPYRVYGAQQDNSTISVPSRSDEGSITQADWYEVGGGESGYIAVRPDDPNVVFAGSYGGLLTRYDHRTKQVRNITVWPDNPMGAGVKDMKYRFQWTFPIVISPHDPNVLYVTAQVVLRSTNEGHSWEPISPDLTRNDTTKMGPSGGPITKDNTGVEYYGTIFAFAESPVQRGVLWAGSDDGLIHVSRDGGKTWQNVTPPDLPEWALISIIEPSPHDAGTAYVAATRYKLDDFRPYLYKTTDYGRTWTRITNGIPDDDFTRVIRADPVRRGLLVAGTETGIYVSFDDGGRWHRLQGNLPVVPIHDLVIKDDDLVVGTHGRSFWILDDWGIVRQFTPEVFAAPAHLFKPERTVRFRGGGGFGGAGGALLAGQNPPNGAVIYYYLKERPQGEVVLTIRDARGQLVRRFSSRAPERSEGAAPGPTGTEEMGFPGGGPAGMMRLPAEPGLNRFIWNLRYPDARTLPGLVLWAGTTAGPLAVPGLYTVELSVDGRTYTQSFELLKDPRLPTTQEEFEEQFRLYVQVRDKLSETHEAILQIRDLRQQLEAWGRRVQGHPRAQEVQGLAREITAKLTAIEEELIQTRIRASQDALNYPIKLNNKLAALLNVIQSADARPTQQTYEVFRDLSGRVDRELARLRTVVSEDLPRFNRLVRDLELPALQTRVPATNN